MLHRSIIFKTVLVFLASYLISLLLWIQIKDTYGYVIAATASRLVGEVKNVRVEKIWEEKGVVYTSFCRLMRKEDLVVDLAFTTSNYTFNVPLTFAILASLCLFISRRRRAYAEAVVLLVLVHFLFVFSLGVEQLTIIFMSKGIEAISRLKLFMYQFLWGFTGNMLIRAEPFLIGFYMYVRFKKT